MGLKEMGNVFDNKQLIASLMISIAFEQTEKKIGESMDAWQKRFVSAVVGVGVDVDKIVMERIAKLQSNWKVSDGKVDKG